MGLSWREIRTVNKDGSINGSNVLGNMFDGRSNQFGILVSLNERHFVVRQAQELVRSHQSPVTSQ